MSKTSTSNRFQYRAFKQGSARFRRLRRLPILRKLWLLQTSFFGIFVFFIPFLVLAGMLVERLTTTYYLVTGPAGGTYATMGEPVVETLNSPSRFRRIFRMDFMPDFEAKPSNGALDNMHQINLGLAELGFAEDGMPPHADKPAACATAQEKAKAKQQAQPVVRLRALMPLYKSPLHIVARRDFPIQDVSRLPRGARVYMGPEGSATAVLAQVVLTHFGICVTRVGPDWSFGKAAEALESGKADVGIFLTGLKSSEALNQLSDSKRFKLLSIKHADGLASLYTYLHALTIPAAAYSGFEERDIETVNTNTILVASSSLSPTEAYQVLNKLSVDIHEITHNIPFNATRLGDLNPQKDLSYSLHEGAVRFYAHNPPFILDPKRLAAIGTYLSLLVALYKVFMQYFRRFLVARLTDAIARVRSAPPSKRQENNLIKLKLVTLELLRERRLTLEDYHYVNEYLKGKA
jgi:TRAP transporter TAXI family solute receptor